MLRQDIQAERDAAVTFRPGEWGGEPFIEAVKSASIVDKPRQTQKIA